MENQNKLTSIEEIGEFGLIDRLSEQIIYKNASTVEGVGDDAAVLAIAEDRFSLLAADMLVEGIHFDLSYCPLKHLGYKAVVVNISDIYAMNGIPEQITVSIAASSKFPVEAIEELYRGINLAASRYNVDLVGGDLSSSHKGLIISISALGHVAKDQVVYRSQAEEGDLICHTGNLGAAYLGLQLLEREKKIFKENPDVQPELDDHAYLLERQLKPEIPLALFDSFRKLQIKPTSMIDISDGLASDLLHICKASGLGARIREEQVNIIEEAQLMAIEFNLDPITTALSGGEDYEMLFTVKKDDYDLVFQIPEVSIIGEMEHASKGIILETVKGNKHPLTAQGWKHF